MKHTPWHTECVLCDTKLGDNIGGHIIGVHLNKMLGLCDGCRHTMEAFIK